MHNSRQKFFFFCWVSNNKEEMQTLNRLSQCRGRHTNLITLAIANNSDLSKVSKRLAHEVSTAANIKDKTNRTNVIAALARIQDVVSAQKTADAGLAVCCGWCI